MSVHKSSKITVAVDLVLFGIINQRLVMLTGRRTQPPHKDNLSLPGSYIYEDESAPEACDRKIKSIGLKPSYLEQLATFTSPLRDSRKRIIAIAHYGLIPIPKDIPGGDSRINRFEWLDAQAAKKFSWAFDHKEIVEVAVERLRSKIQYSPISPYFLPKEFTISELALVYSAILGRKVGLSNFRRDLLKQNLLTHIGYRHIRGPKAKTYGWNWDNKNKFFLSLG